MLHASQPAVAQDTEPQHEHVLTRYHRKESSALAASQGTAERDGQVLRLRTRDRIVELENSETCEFREEACRLEGVRLRCDDNVNECRSYVLAWYSPRLAAFVVGMGLYEDFRFLWIDGVTGKVTDIGGEPHISPDESRLAVAQTSECCGTSYTGIQVRKTISLEVEFEHASSIDEDYAFFIFSRWVNNESFAVTTERWLTDKQTGQRSWVRGTTLVERKPDGWTLRWIPETAPK